MIQIFTISLGEKSVTNNASNDEERSERIALNQSQKNHIDGIINVYAPIEAYYEQWEHNEDEHGNFVSARPIEETRRRSDMPSLAQQWREDWTKRCKAMEKFNVKSTGDR